MERADHARVLSEGLRIMARASVLVGVGVLMATLGFPAIFDRFNAYDDEGFYLLQLRYAIERRGPYSHIWSEYGPAYNLFVSVVSWSTRIPLDHDGGRILTLVFWAGAAVVAGLFVLRTTRSLALGAATVVVGFLWLDAIVDEPNQPGAIAFIFTLGILLLVQRRDPARRMNTAFVGALCAALLLIKINLGIYAIAAIVFTTVITTDVHPWLRRLVLVASFVLPVALLVHGLSQLNVFLFAATIEIGFVTLVVVAGNVTRKAHVRWQPFVAGGLTALTLLLLGGIFEGDKLGAIFDAVVVHPLGYTSEGKSYSLNMVAAFGASIAALGTMLLLRVKDWPWLRITVRVLVLPAIFIPLFASLRHGVNSGPSAYPALAWAVVPVLLISIRECEWNEITARICLAAFIVFNELQAYPIPGSQEAFGTFLSVPAAFIISKDLFVELRGRRTAGRVRWLGRHGSWLITGSITLCTTALFVQSSVQQWSAYVGNGSLDLPGSSLVRLPPPQVATLNSTVKDVDSRSCSSLITFPGMLSFYSWTDLSPPRGLVIDDSIGWQQLDERQAVVRHLRRLRNGCAIGNSVVEAFWDSILTLPKWPGLEGRLVTKFNVNVQSHGQGYVVSQSGSG